MLSRGSKKIRSLLKKDAKARTGCGQEGHKKHIASENESCGYFTLLVQHEFAGGLADRCAEETGEEGQNRLLSRGAKKHIASGNVSCGYFTLLVQHEFAGGLADRCAEETGEEGMILET